MKTTYAVCVIIEHKKTTCYIWRRRHDSGFMMVEIPSWPVQTLSKEVGFLDFQEIVLCYSWWLIVLLLFLFLFFICFNVNVLFN